MYFTRSLPPYPPFAFSTCFSSICYSVCLYENRYIFSTRYFVVCRSFEIMRNGIDKANWARFINVEGSTRNNFPLPPHKKKIFCCCCYLGIWSVPFAYLSHPHLSCFIRAKFESVRQFYVLHLYIFHLFRCRPFVPIYWEIVRVVAKMQ